MQMSWHLAVTFNESQLSHECNPLTEHIVALLTVFVYRTIHVSLASNFEKQYYQIFFPGQKRNFIPNPLKMKHGEAINLELLFFINVIHIIRENIKSF